MPTYVYRREDGTKFEIKQSITADPLETCPETGQPVERIISGSAGLIFKGSGFYETDYKRSNGSSGASSPSNGTDSSSSDASSGSASGESSSGTSSTSESSTASESKATASGDAD
jgi:putative FmdB family regulatory protein